MDKRYGESLDDWAKQTPKSPKKDSNQTSVADVMYTEASRLNSEKRYKEALTLINVAIEHNETNFEYYTKKGTVLENLNRFSESYGCYMKALELEENDKTKEQLARMLYKWANSLNDKEKALELIEEAILILPESCRDTYHERFWYLKGSILDCLSRPIDSRRSYLIAEGMTDEIKELDRQVEFLKTSKDTLINITGTRFYFGLEPFKKGMVVNLIRETDNEHDPDAIRVEFEGETVGYVANNDYTLIENVKSASEIRKMENDKAEVVLVYLDEYVIAKLI